MPEGVKSAMKYGVLVKTNSHSAWGEMQSWCTDLCGRKLVFESREQAQEAAKALNQHTGLACGYRYFASPLNGAALS